LDVARKGKSSRRIVIIAGPNGAGKTTFAEQFLLGEAECPEFINADLIARGLAPFAPGTVDFEAARIMLSQIRAHAKAGKSFAFETTLSGTAYARLIPKWQSAGFHVGLVFLSLPQVEIALARIRARVSQGGHDVPEPVVRRRFERGLKNFEQVYRKLVDSWALYDSSGQAPALIDAGDKA
jgi:predicted ABC-type ATPase